MTDIPLLWSPWGRKENFDLLVSLWPTLDEAQRAALGELIAAGPPDALMNRISDENDRRSYSRRMIFDRIAVIDRIGHPPIEGTLRALKEEILRETPNMGIAEGDRAHFSSYTENGSWSPRQQGSKDIKELSIAEWSDLLSTNKWEADSNLMAWRDLARADPGHVVGFLRSSISDQATPGDLWTWGLQGLRDTVLKSENRSEVLELLLTLPETLLNEPQVSSASADLLEAISNLEAANPFDDRFWRAFDRTLLAAAQDESNSDDQGDNGWNSLAINRSLGRLATTFLNALFARGLVVGQGLPEDFLERFARVLNTGSRAHLPARIVAASRLSYLFAVDPDWTTTNILPAFSWDRPSEAIASWAGYTSYPSIDPQLWAALKPSFLATLEAKQMSQLDKSTVRVLVQLLALVGLVFGLLEVPHDKARKAIKEMPPEVRIEMASWVANYVKKAIPSENPETERESEDESPDTIWKKRVEPWLGAVWPTERAFQTAPVFKKFAAAAIATSSAFPAAVETISPFAVSSRVMFTLKELARSEHPSRHPRPTLKLLDLLLSKEEDLYDLAPLRTILTNVLAADGSVASIAVYQSWWQFLLLRGG